MAPIKKFKRRLGQARRRKLRRVNVEIPTLEGGTDAIFLLLRRLRGPLLALITVFTIAVVGLVRAPGVVVDGHVTHLSAFEAFYVMSYTATTIGYGEFPPSFSTAQRMWLTVCIYLSVICWAYFLGSILAMVQDAAFRRAVAVQRFGRTVRRLHEPFFLIVGYGRAGRALATSLDRAGQRVVVIDEDPDRIDVLTRDQLSADAPALTADPRNPAVLGQAGLGHPHLAGVMAMTDKDDMNLAVVMSAELLRPDVRVIARCSHRANVQAMRSFSAEAVIDPFDRYGNYLVMALHHPKTYRLVSWLLRQPGSALPPPVKAHLADGPWVVVTDGSFGQEVARDLEEAGLDVVLAEPADYQRFLTGAVGLVAGAESDVTNLSIAASARLTNPDIYLSVRQKSVDTGPLLRSFAPESVFTATDIVAFEALARVEAPNFWNFLEFAMKQDDEWSKKVLKGLVARVGKRTPTAVAITLDEASAPAVYRWLAAGKTLTLGQLLADPDDRDQPLSVYPTELIRKKKATVIPDLDTELEVGDTIALLVRSAGYGLLLGNLGHDVAIEYLATGREVPATWLARALAGRRRPAAEPMTTQPMTTQPVTTRGATTQPVTTRGDGLEAGPLDPDHPALRPSRTDP